MEEMENTDSPDQQSLELHIESCERCQSVLQDLAAASRMELATMTGAAIHLPKSEPKLPGFRIERELGRGGGSVVYLAEDLSTSRMVAVKLIPGGWIQGALLRARWLEEVRVAAQMEHHHIVRLYRVEETLHWFLLVFEYITGGTLQNRVQQPMPPMELAILMRTLAQAVEQIHQRGVLHLDLKPSNILLDDSLGSSWSEVVPKVSDFGIARWNQTCDQPGLSGLQGQGTPSYMAPEQILADFGPLTPATDVYGLGGILYTMLTGVPPFRGTCAPEILRQVIADRVQPPQHVRSDVSSELAEIALRCLQKHPKNRFPTPQHLARALQAWIDSETETDEVRSTQRWRKSVALTPIALLVGGLLAIAGTMLWRMTNGRDSHLHAVTTPASEQQDVDSWKSDLSVSEWLEELAEEPAAFDPRRAGRLVAASRRFTEELLTRRPTPVDQWLRFGVLQQRAAERITVSLRAELYPAARELLEESVRLLESAVEQQPEDQTTRLELIGAKVSQSQVRIQIDQYSPDQRTQHTLDCASSLLPTTSHVLRLKDQKQRVHWMGRILDQYRGTFWMTLWEGDEPTATQLGVWERQCWSLLGDEQRHPDLACRHALMQTSAEPEGWVVQPEDGWIIPENRRLLAQEAVFTHLADRFFRAARLSETTDDSSLSENEWNEIIVDSQAFMQQRKIDPSLLPGNLHYELIRPVATISTIYRCDRKIDQAESLQRAYLSLCKAASSYYPGDVEVCLAASEAQLQAWKNAIRRGHTEAAMQALQASLREAEIALDFAPDSTRARFQVADRIKRLARAENP
jgi:serine/threonine protein kinase